MQGTSISINVLRQQPLWLQDAGELCGLGRTGVTVTDDLGSVIERVDVLVARTVPTRDGIRVAFDDLWERHRVLVLGQDVEVAVPTLDHLILTKRFGGRPKDLEDIRLLEALRSEESE